jgi:SOS response regulatory protein OraA/RecX
MKYSDKIIKGINNNTIDTEELKTKFKEYLYNKGYYYEEVKQYTDEHFENLLTFKQNERKFIKSLVD